MSHVDEAFETYMLLEKCGPAVSLYLWEATLAWVEDAEEHNYLGLGGLSNVTQNTGSLHFPQLPTRLQA